MTDQLDPAALRALAETLLRAAVDHNFELAPLEVLKAEYQYESRPSVIIALCDALERSQADSKRLDVQEASRATVTPRGTMWEVWRDFIGKPCLVAEGPTLRAAIDAASLLPSDAETNG